MQTAEIKFFEMKKKKKKIAWYCNMTIDQQRIMERSISPSAQVDYLSGNLSFSGGSLASTFQVVQFHFHWGSNSSIGSEHSINGQTFPMEVRTVRQTCSL